MVATTWTLLEVTSGWLCIRSLNMKSLVKLLLFLMLIEVPSNKSKESGTNMNNILKDNQCSNDSACPMWFTCNAKKKCLCDDGHKDRILCDNQAQCSAVLNCNCVTYNKDKNSSYVGGCFYNYVSLNQNHAPIQQLLTIQKC